MEYQHAELRDAAELAKSALLMLQSRMTRIKQEREDTQMREQVADMLAQTAALVEEFGPSAS